MDHKLIVEKVLEKFVCRDKKRAAAKLGELMRAGADRVFVVTDFDRTITPLHNESGEEISTWGLLSRKLPKDIQLAEIELYKKYRPLEVVGKMTVEDALEWWSVNLDYYQKSDLRWADIENEVKEAIPARPGAVDLFGVCREKKIPAVILSAGIKDVIDLWCQKYKVRSEMILSTKLCFDDRGYVCGWDKDSLVHTLNKGEIGRKDLAALKQSRPHSILIGDSLDDAAMIGQNESSLRVFVDNRPEKNSKTPGFYDKVFEKFDLTIQSQTLFPVVGIVEAL